MELFSESRKKMVECQLASRDIKDKKVLEAFMKVPRHMFIKESQAEDAYGDYPLPIGHGQTISQPYMVALMTQCLELKGSEKVLEIGTGSGYQTAILAELAKEVYSIELIEELTLSAKDIIDQLGYENVRIMTGDGTIGWKEFAPYDRIIVTAGSPALPKPLESQLAENGKIVIPVGDRSAQVLTVIKKTNGVLSEAKECGCVFVPLVGKYGWR